MTVEPKLSWLWAILIPCIVAGGVWWRSATAETRLRDAEIKSYKAQNEDMRLVWERQDLDLKMYYQRQELTEINEREQSSPMPEQ